MRKLFALLLFLVPFLTVNGQEAGEPFFVAHASAGGATPITLVQMRASPTDVQDLNGLASNTVSSGNLFISCFANTTQVSNTVILKLRSSYTTTANIAVTDDGSSSNTYTLAAQETAGSRITAVYIAPVVHTSRCLTITFSAAGTQTDNEVEMYEYDNLATSSPVDVSCTGTVTSGTAPACSSSMTPTVAKDLILTFCDVVTFTSTPTGSMTFTAQSGSSPTYTLLHADGTSWSATANAVDAATSAITPSMTLSQSTTRANVVALALKSATNGGAFSGIHVNNVTYYAPEFANSTAIAGTSQTLQFPCVGNGIWVVVGQGASGATSNLTGISDGTNTFTQLTNLYNSGDGYAIQWVHADGATCSGTETLTLSFTSNPSFLVVTAFDLSNATGYDSSATCGAGSTPCAINQSAGGNTGSTTTVPGAVITPSTSPGIVLSYANQDFNAMAAITPASFVKDIESCPGQGTGCSGSGVGTYAAYAYEGSGSEQDAGSLVNYYSSTSAITITWTMANVQNKAIGPFFSSTVAVKQ